MSVIVLGSINMDVVMRVAELPRPGETVNALDQHLYPGGKGANQAIASARAGAPTAILGAVGEDEYGSDLRRNLEENGVSTQHLLTLSGAPTGQAAITVSKAGENMIVVLPGANYRYEQPRAGGVEDLGLAKSTVRLTQFEMPLAEIEKFFRPSGEDTGVRILNPAPALPKGRYLFDLSDIIIVNETELAVYTDVPVEQTQAQDNAVALARSLMTRPEQWVIVTLGAQGAIVIGAEEEIAVQGSSAEVVDTTGAGDCFCGALAAQLSECTPIQDAVTFANIAAGIAVTRHGAGPSMPTREEVIGQACLSVR